MNIPQLAKDQTDVNVNTGRGRPSKFTPELAAKYLQLVVDGAYPSVAAKACRVSYDTIVRWLRTGLKAEEEGDESPEMSGFRLFALAVKEAEAEAEQKAMQKILDIGHASNQWQALAWFLERRFPERWSRVERKEIDAKVSGKLELEVTVEQKRKLLEILAEEVKEQTDEESEQATEP